MRQKQASIIPSLDEMLLARAVFMLLRCQKQCSQKKAYQEKKMELRSLHKMRV
jgi:hypothetical protein